MCRPFKRPRAPAEKEANGIFGAQERVVRSRLSNQSRCDDTMAEAPAPSPADKDDTASAPGAHPRRKQQAEDAEAAHDQHTNGFGTHGVQTTGNGDAIWSPDEVPVSNGHNASTDSSGSNSQQGLQSAANAAGSNGVGKSTDEEQLQQPQLSKQQTAPLQRMSWMQDTPPMQNGTADRPASATNGHAETPGDANGDVEVDDTGAAPSVHAAD